MTFTVKGITHQVSLRPHIKVKSRDSKTYIVTKQCPDQVSVSVGVPNCFVIIVMVELTEVLT